MTGIVVFAAVAAFALFLIPGGHRKYTAVAGWSCIVINLWLELPAYIAELNFLYPALALLSLPFLFITVRHLLCDDPVALRLTMSAAVATLIFVPFTVIPVLRDALVGSVVTFVYGFVTLLGHQPVLYAWDVIEQNGFFNQIIAPCTGILAIAMVTGIIAGVPHAPARQRVLVAVPVAVLLFVLNLLRVTGVFIAVSGRWFDGLPDPTGTGDANFFWAHNVIAEALAVAFLLLLIAALCRVLPGLRDYAKEVAALCGAPLVPLLSRGGPSPGSKR